MSELTETYLTDALHTAHDNVKFLSWSELCYQDVPVDRANIGIGKHVSLVPNRDPRHVLGVH